MYWGYWMNPLRSKKFAWLGAFVIFLVTVSTFLSNRLHTADRDSFGSFDRFSQGLVIGNIVAHDAGVADPTWNLGFVTVNGDPEQSDNIWNTYKQAVASHQPVLVTQVAYRSQYGIQGVAFRAIHDELGIDSLKGLQFFNVAAFALVVTALTFLFARTYDWRFGIAFFLVMIGSPWVVSFARNLYWVPFTWFLPAVFAAMAYLAKNWRERVLCLIGVGAAVFLKSLAGYEYLSNVTLFACAVFVIAPFFREKDRQHWFNFKLGCLAFVVCIAGFAAALLIHANMRGDTIAQGLINILEQDVKKRTYGDPSHFDPVLRASLTSTIPEVISMYWTQWRTAVVFWMPAQVLNFASVFVLLGLIYSAIKRKTVGMKVLAVLVIYFLASISWFVAAKAHSYIHTQLNYVLWSFGFLQALVYGVWSFALMFGRDALAWRKTLNRKQNLWLAGGAITSLVVLACLTEYWRTNGVDRQIDQRLAGAIASSDVGNGFQVLFFNDKPAVLKKTGCRDFNAKYPVLLHVFPDAPNAGMSNMDFAWQQHAISSTWFSKYRDSCMAELPLPPLRIKSFEIGQYETDGHNAAKVIWEGSAVIGDARYINAVQPLDFTDGNWEKGINRVSPALLVPNNFSNRQSLKVGDVLKVDASQQRAINQIVYSGDFINVYLDAPLLNPVQSGFPNNLEIVLK